jgi:CBS domain-containing protein
MKVMPTKPSLFGYTLDRLALGTFSNVVSCTIETRLVDVLFILDMKHFAAIPVVDSKGKCVDMFYKSMITRVPHDTLLLAMEKPVLDFLAVVRRSHKERHFRCMRHDTLETILSRMMDYRLRSLVVVDDRDYVQGVVALGDILRLFLV